MKMSACASPDDALFFRITTAFRRAYGFACAGRHDAAENRHGRLIPMSADR